MRTVDPIRYVASKSPRLRGTSHPNCCLRRIFTRSFSPSKPAISPIVVRSITLPLYEYHYCYNLSYPIFVMKAHVAAAAVVAATGAYAQSVSYTTVTYDDCPSASMETMITITNGVTVTYCPKCEEMSSTPGSGPGYTTVYTTTYESLCPTGIVPATYTVTESCTEPTPTWTPGPSHIPQGFTVTTKECTVCAKTPTTVTITEPCGCEAHNGTPGPAPNNNPAPTGAPPSPGSGGSGPGTSPATPTGGSSPGGGPSPGGGSGSSPPACDGEECGGSGSQSPGGSPPGGSSSGSSLGGSSPGGSSPGGSPPAGSSPGSSPPACNGEECGGSGHQSPGGSPPAPGSGGAPPPYPSATTSAHACPGPDCRAAPSGSYPTGVEYGNTTGITPGNSASSLGSFNFLSSAIMAVVVAAFAVAL